ncbi:MAG: hypothetical protein RL653_613 [Pseudomonadota bacterium]|jgi:hypothetical protein
MKLLGREVTAQKVLERIEDRLRARGLLPADAGLGEGSAGALGVEPRVDPLSYNVHALEEHADPTVGLPLETHRGGAGQLVLVAKWAFRKTGQVFINEALSRQRLFNGHVRDAYAQLSAEVLQLRAEVARLKAEKEAAQAAPPKATPAKAGPAAGATSGKRAAARPARKKPSRT